MKLISKSFLAIFSMLTAVAVQAQVEGPQRTSALVRVQDKRGVEAPPVDPKTVKVKFGNSDREVVGWQPVLSSPEGTGTGVQVALMIDDGLRSSLGRMMGDIQSFIQSLPPEAEVMVGYMQNGRVVPAIGFTTNHEAAAKAVRLPMSSPGQSASPYFCLSDLVKKWKPNGKAHIAMMITDGVDPYNGSTSILNQNSTYVEAAISDAQRAGVAVYSIYFSGAGFGAQRASFSGQSYLSQTAEGTGGRAYYIGTGNPVSFAPFFHQFTDAIAETHQLSFLAGGKGLQSFKAEAPDVKLVGPTRVQAGQ